MPAKKMTFEASMERLGEIVARLEAGSDSLEDSIKLFEEGTALAAYCYQKLNAAEQKIKELTLEEDSGEEAED